MILPVMYDNLSIHEKRLVREDYVKLQEGKYVEDLIKLREARYLI